MAYTRLPELRNVGRYAIHRSQFSDWYRIQLNRFRSRSAANAEASSINSKSVENAKTVKKTEAQKLAQVVQESQDNLVEATSVFPFTFFRTTVCVDRHKLTIQTRMLLQAGQVVGVPIENIKNIQSTLGPIFGSPTITSDHFVNNIQEIKYLHRKDADQIQKIVQGAIVAIREKVAINKIEPNRLKKMLYELGAGIAS